MASPLETPACSFVPQTGQWSRAHTTPANQNVFGIAFGNGYFVATCAYGDLLRSTDGLTWASNSTGSDIRFGAIAFGSGVFIATGNKTLYRSTDGFSWSAVVSSTDDIDGQFYSLSYANGLVHSSPHLSNRLDPPICRWHKLDSHGRQQCSFRMARLEFSNLRQWPLCSSGIERFDPSLQRREHLANRFASCYGGLDAVSFGNDVFVAIGYDYSAAGSSNSSLG
jgi:hypothetical protein